MFVPIRARGQRHLGAECEEQLEVFAVAERLRERATASDRDARFGECESAAARLRKARQVGGKAVAHIHHRVRFEMRDKPARLGESRGERRDVCPRANRLNAL
jgi:hypothetical protein